MKKCDHFKDFILTDFIDGELSKDAAGNLESHLLDCSSCRVFLQEVKGNAVLPFQQALRQPVPTGLWNEIKQRIERQEQATNPFMDFINRLKGLLAFPRMVPVFASLIVMLLVGSVTLNTMQIQRAKDKDQGEYLVSLLSAGDSSTTAESSDGGTSIEHYFL